MALTKINASVIANNTIAVGNIADNSVDATKIASNSILTRHIDDNQVTTDQIAANTIATANIADNAVDGTKIASNSILTRHIDDDQVTGDQLSDNITIAGTLTSTGDATFNGTNLYFKGAASSANYNLALENSDTFTSFFATTNSGVNKGYKFFSGNQASDLALTIADDMKVGIGVVPTHNFNLEGTGTVEARFRSSDGDMSLQISSDADETHNSELNFMSGTSGRGAIVYDHNTTAASQSMTFKTGDLGVSAMTILGDGNVGIGTTNPTAILDVVGPAARPTSLAEVDTGSTARFRSDSSNADSLYIAEAASGALIQVNDGATNSSTAKPLVLQPFGGYVGIGASTDLSGVLNITHGAEFGLVTSGPYNFQAKFESTDAEAAIVIEDSNSGTDYNRIGVITNDMAFTTNNSEKMRIDSSGSVGIGTPSVPINDSGGTQPLYLTMHRDAGNLIELSADHASSGELIGGIDFTNDNNADAANNDADGKLVALMRARTYTDDSNAGDDSGGALQFATKDNGGVLAERLKINQTGEVQIKGQYNSSGNSQFAFKTVYYQFDMNSGGTHYLEVPLYSSYSSSNSGGWAEMDIAWFPDHASHTHLHSYKFMWGSDHTRVLNLGVISATANETSSSYGPYNITSKSQLFRHPTAGENNMTYLYIKMQGYHSVNKRRVITLRGVASADVNTASIGPVIDHGSTEPVANMVSVNAEIESA